MTGRLEIGAGRAGLEPWLESAALSGNPPPRVPRSGIRIEYHPDEEVCPWCGGFFYPRDIVEWSGWCAGCTAMFLGQHEPTAHCSGCDQWLPVSDFSPRKSGKTTWCRRCESRQRAEWRKAHPEREREAQRRQKARRRARENGGCHPAEDAVGSTPRKHEAPRTEIRGAS